MTGTLRIPSSGIWTFNFTSDTGLRVWINGQLFIDNWVDSPLQQTINATYYFPTANTLYSIRVDYYHLSANGNANLSLAMTPPGGSQTSQVASYFSPNYGLTTATTTYDNTIGNTVTNTGYGTSPQLGLASSSAVDPTGLNLSTGSTYETPGTGYERETSQTSPGGSTTSYSYYGASDTASNPCVSGSTAAYQAGMLKTLTDPSPDNGTTPGEATTSVYDDAGNIVASETNTDGWECKTYDARGRITQDVIPAFNGAASRTITYNYDVGGNPLVTSTTDSGGTITTTSDLLGRTVSYEDTLGDTTNTTYDSLGRIQSEVGPEGTETYSYNNYNQLTDEVLNGDHLAQPSYDQYGRVSQITYSTAGTLKATPSYSTTTGAETSVIYNLSDGTSLTDSINPDTIREDRVRDTLTSGSSTLTSSYTYDKARPSDGRHNRQ